MRELRIARFRQLTQVQLALDLGEPGGEDRWNMLPEQARQRVLTLLAAMIAQSALAEPGPGGDRGE